MPILKNKYKSKYKPPQPTFCPRCGYTVHRLRFDNEGGWTYFACDICEYWVGEEVLIREAIDASR